MRRFWDACLWTWCAVVLLALLVTMGLRYNHTASMPRGWYWVVEKRPAAGDLVMLECPLAVAKERGYLDPGDLLLKRVAAAGGDSVSLDDDGFTVNGQRLARTAPLEKDPSGRYLPVFACFDYELPPDELLVLGDTDLSFDSRYFGPVKRSDIRCVVRPLWTW